MPTIEPRIQITPSPKAAPALRELARIRGIPMSRLVRELLDECVPAIEIALKALRTFEEAPDQARAAVADYIAESHAMVTQCSLDLDRAMRKKPGPKPGSKRQGRASKA